MKKTTSMKRDNIKNCLSSAATKTLGYRKSIKEEWLTQDTWALISERKKIKSKILDCRDIPELITIQVLQG